MEEDSIKRSHIVRFHGIDGSTQFGYCIGSVYPVSLPCGIVKRYLSGAAISILFSLQACPEQRRRIYLGVIASAAKQSPTIIIYHSSLIIYMAGDPKQNVIASRPKADPAVVACTQARISYNISLYNASVFW